MKSYVKANLTNSGAVVRTLGGLWVGEASFSRYASASVWKAEYDMRWKKLFRVGFSFSCPRLGENKKYGPFNTHSNHFHTSIVAVLAHNIHVFLVKIGTFDKFKQICKFNELKMLGND